MPRRETTNAIGLTLAALVIGLAYLCGGFVPRHEWLLAAGTGGGVRLHRRVRLWITRVAGCDARSAARIGVELVHRLSCNNGFAGGVRWTWIWPDAASVPVPADATHLHRTVNVVLWDESEPFIGYYATGLSAEKTDAFLTEQFTARGWQVLVTSEPQQFHVMAKQVLAMKMGLRGKIELHSAYTLRRGPRFVQVYVLDDSTKRWVLFSAFPSQTPRALRRFQR